MPDKFVRNEFEQLRWPEGETSWMKFIAEPTGTYLRRVSVSKVMDALTLTNQYQDKALLYPDTSTKLTALFIHNLL
jgi:hypothetical protein